MATDWQTRVLAGVKTARIARITLDALLISADSTIGAEVAITRFAPPVFGTIIGVALAIFSARAAGVAQGVTGRIARIIASTLGEGVALCTSPTGRAECPRPAIVITKAATARVVGRVANGVVRLTAGVEINPFGEDVRAANTGVVTAQSTRTQGHAFGVGITGPTAKIAGITNGTSRSAVFELRVGAALDTSHCLHAPLGITLGIIIT